MKKLLSPIKIGKIQMENRLVFPPLATGKSEENGHISDELLAYYDEKSKGGLLQLIIVEHSYVNLQGKVSDRQASVADDSSIEGFHRLSQIIHKNKARAIVQINHGGAVSHDKTGFPVIAPSSLEHPWQKGRIPEPMTTEQIHAIVEDYQKAAIRVQKAGFDGVEIHSAHTYLLNQFYSPFGNQRTDEYGGSLENRLRVHVQIIKAVREAAGPDFLLALRLGACDYKEGGNTIEDGVEAAKILVRAGVDLLDISGGYCGSQNPCSDAPGYFSDSSTAIKNAVDVPVILTGGIVTAQQAEELLNKGAADLIGVGRAVLQDSNWAKKQIPDTGCFL